MTSEAFSLRDREAEEEDAELITFQTRRAGHQPRNPIRIIG